MESLADDGDGNDACVDDVDAGEIEAGHTVTALYAVQLRTGVEGRSGMVGLRREDPSRTAVQEINGNFNTWDLAGSSSRYPLGVVAQSAEILRRSPYAQGTRLDEGRVRADRLSV
jgi:Ca-activated chloride channel homolog